MATKTLEELQTEEEQAKSTYEEKVDLPDAGIGMALIGLGMGLQGKGGQFQEIVERKKNAVRQKRKDLLDSATRAKEQMQAKQERDRDRALAQQRHNESLNMQRMSATIGVTKQISDMIGKGNHVGAAKLSDKASEFYGVDKVRPYKNKDGKTVIFSFPKNMDADAVMGMINAGDPKYKVGDKLGISAWDEASNSYKSIGVNGTLADAYRLGGTMDMKQLETQSYVDYRANGGKLSPIAWKAEQQDIGNVTEKEEIANLLTKKNTEGLTREEDARLSALQEASVSRTEDVTKKDVIKEGRDTIRGVVSGVKPIDTVDVNSLVEAQNALDSNKHESEKKTKASIEGRIETIKNLETTLGVYDRLRKSGMEGGIFQDVATMILKYSGSGGNVGAFANMTPEQFQSVLGLESAVTSQQMEIIKDLSGLSYTDSQLKQLEKILGTGFGKKYEAQIASTKGYIESQRKSLNGKLDDDLFVSNNPYVSYRIKELDKKKQTDTNDGWTISPSGFKYRKRGE